jgi:hypothetical protein
MENLNISARDKAVYRQETQPLVEVLKVKVLDSLRRAYGRRLDIKGAEKILGGKSEDGLERLYSIETDDSDEIENDICGIVTELRAAMGEKVFYVKFVLNNEMIFDNVLFVPAALTMHPVLIRLNGFSEMTVVAGQLVASPPISQSRRPSSSFQAISAASISPKAPISQRFEQAIRPSQTALSSPPSSRSQNLPMFKSDKPETEAGEFAHVPNTAINVTLLGFQEGSEAGSRLNRNLMINKIFTFRELVSLFKTVAPSKYEKDHFMECLNSEAAKRANVAMSTEEITKIMARLYQREYIRPKK